MPLTTELITIMYFNVTFIKMALATIQAMYIGSNYTGDQQVRDWFTMNQKFRQHVWQKQEVL